MVLAGACRHGEAHFSGATDDVPMVTLTVSYRHGADKYCTRHYSSPTESGMPALQVGQGNRKTSVLDR